MAHMATGAKSKNLVLLLQVPEHRPWATERQLRRMVAEKRIPYYKVRGRVLLDLDDIDWLAESGRVEATR